MTHHEIANQIDEASAVSRAGSVVTMQATTWAIHKYTMATLVGIVLVVLFAAASDYLKRGRLQTEQEGRITKSEQEIKLLERDFAQFKLAQEKVYVQIITRFEAQQTALARIDAKLERLMP